MTRLTQLLYLGTIIVISNCSTKTESKVDNNLSNLSSFDTDSVDTSYLKLTAKLALENKDFEFALNEYQKLLKTDSLNGQYYFRIAYCLAQLDKHAEAVDYYIRAAELDFEPFESYRSLGILYSIVLGDESKAIFYLKKCKLLKPEDKEIIGMLKLLTNEKPINTI